MTKQVTVLVRAGFKIQCDPAGTAELNINGEMNIPAIEDVIELLEQVSARLRRKTREAKEQLAESGNSAVK